MRKAELLRMLYGKYNELESIKKHVIDSEVRSVIEAKQDTINDVLHLVESVEVYDDSE